METGPGLVECYSGSRYAERPVAIHAGGERLLVQEVLGRWRTPAGPGFEVLAGGRRFRLDLDEKHDRWSVQELMTG